MLVLRIKIKIQEISLQWKNKSEMMVLNFAIESMVK